MLCPACSVILYERVAFEYYALVADFENGKIRFVHQFVATGQ